jgi:polyhydroxyalkanoate synthesis regulator phasin
MKKILFASIITLGIGTVIAQDLKKEPTTAATQQVMSSRTAGMVQASPETSAQRRVDRLTKEIDLNKDQQKKIYDLLLQEAKANGNRGAYNEETENKVNALLSAEQVAKLDQIKAERVKAMEQRNSERAKKMESSPAGKNINIAK